MNLLEFANPIGWWWAALAIPLALLYILKVRLRRQTVSTFLFWDQVFQEKKPRSWWQQLRHLLSLLLQLAFLILLVLALVDPLWQWQKSQRRKVLVVIDNSASMAAQAEGKSRLELAKETANALVRSLRVGDEMAILAAGGKPEVAIGLTDHSRSLLDTVAAIEQTDAPSALSETVTAAKRLLLSDTQSVIYVLTDGCDDAVKELVNDKSINLVGCGVHQNNVAITQFQVRRSLLDAIGYQILIEVTNFGDQDYKGRLELNLEEQLVDVIPLELKPDQPKTLHLDQASATGGRLIARLDADDALAIDNQALAVLPTRRPIDVALATPGSLFLTSVLQSIPLVDVKVFQQAIPSSESTTADSSINQSANTASANSVSANSVSTNTNSPDNGPASPDLSAIAAIDFQLPPEALRPIIVLHQVIPSQLPTGKLLVINPAKNSPLWTLGEPLTQPIVASVAEDSPVTQHVKLTNVLFPQARALTFAQDAEVLIKTPLDEPLLARLKRPAGDVLVLNVNLDEGDLPLRIAFPVLMKNVLEWFDGSQGDLQRALSTGSTTTVALPQVKATSAASVSNAPQATGDGNGTSGSVVAENTSPEPVNESSTEQLAKVESVSKSDTAEGADIGGTDYWVRDPLGRLTPLAHDAEFATLSVLKHSGLWAIGTESSLKADAWLNDSQPGKATTADTNSTASATRQSEAEVPAAHETASQEARRLGAVRYLACNLANRSESDIRPRLELSSASQLGLISLGGRSIWFFCVCAALVLTAIEWWLYQRRIVG